MRKTLNGVILLIFFLCATSAVAERNIDIAEHTFRFTYETTIHDVPADAGNVNVFIPVPESNEYQDVKHVTIDAPFDYQFKRDTAYGNKIMAMYLPDGQAPSSFTITMTCEVSRKAVTSPGQYTQNTPDNELTKFLTADSLIPLNATIRKQTNKALSNHEGQKDKSKALYDYVLSNMTYDKTGTGWGKGDAMYACDAQKGNCSDFHSLFIGMSRVEQIPARFHIGFPVPCNKKHGTISGYHCWAEFHNPDKGWVPVDISEAWKKKEKASFYYGGLDACRIQFTTGRDIPLRINQTKTVQLNYFIYPYVAVDGERFNQTKTEFSFQTL